MTRLNKSKFLNVLFCIVTIIIGVALAILIKTSVMNITRENKTYKDTGLRTEQDLELHYDIETKFVQESYFNNKLIWIRRPYHTEYGAVYKFNENTGKIYIDTEQLKEGLNELREDN